MQTIQRRTARRLAPNAGITLIEMLVVVTIIALFSSIAYQRLTPALEQGRRVAAQTQIENLSAALQRFNIDYARFPTEEEGFEALRPYLTKEIPSEASVVMILTRFLLAAQLRHHANLRDGAEISRRTSRLTINATGPGRAMGVAPAKEAEP